MKQGNDSIFFLNGSNFWKCSDQLGIIDKYQI